MKDTTFNNIASLFEGFVGCVENNPPSKEMFLGAFDASFKLFDDTLKRFTDELDRGDDTTICLLNPDVGDEDFSDAEARAAILRIRRAVHVGMRVQRMKAKYAAAALREDLGPLGLLAILASGLPEESPDEESYDGKNAWSFGEAVLRLCRSHIPEDFGDFDGLKIVPLTLAYEQCKLRQRQLKDNSGDEAVEEYENLRGLMDDMRIEVSAFFEDHPDERSETLDEIYDIGDFEDDA